MLKKYFKRLLHLTGYDLVRRLKIEDNIPYMSFSHFLSIYFSLIDKENFFFIQIGANDGKTGDPLYEFIRYYDLPGLLIEPQPLVFKQLLENYKGLRSLQFGNFAVAEKNGNKSLYKVSDSIKELYDNNVPGNTTGISSFHKEHIDKQLRKNMKDFFKTRDTDSYIDSEIVKCKTFKQIISDYHISRIDLLQIDTEGFDFELIKMFFDCSNIKPKIVNYENLNLTFYDKTECENLLIDKGYKLFRHGKNDTCAFKV